VLCNSDNAFDDVINVSKVPKHLAVVENIDWLFLKDVLGKQEQGHVGPAPRAVHGKEAKPCGGKVVEIAVGVGHHLI